MRRWGTPLRTQSAIALAHPLPDPEVIQSHLLFEHGTLQQFGLMNFLEVTAAEQLGQFLRVDRVVFVASRTDQPVPPRLADHQAVNGMGIYVISVLHT